MSRHFDDVTNTNIIANAQSRPEISTESQTVYMYHQIKMFQRSPVSETINYVLHNNYCKARTTIPVIDIAPDNIVLPKDCDSRSRSSSRPSSNSFSSERSPKIVTILTSTNLITMKKIKMKITN